MEFSVMQLLLELLQRAGISVCIVGELALNYYNAPRIVHVSKPFIYLCASSFSNPATGP